MNKQWVYLIGVGTMLALAGGVRGNEVEKAGVKEAQKEAAHGSARVVEYEAKLRAVIIPQFSTRDAPLSDVLAYLQKAAAESKGKFRVNIVNTVPAKGQPTITLSLQNIPLYDALRYVTQLAGVRLQIEENAVLITPLEPRNVP